METAIIIFFISVVLVVAVPVLLLIIQSIHSYCRDRKRKKYTNQRTEDKSAEDSEEESTYPWTEDKSAEVSEEESTYPWAEDKSAEFSETEAIYKDSVRNVQAVSEAAGYGEFQIYKCLNDYEKEGCKFLFNVYLPKNNGETTEADVLMISPKGIFVFESKNLSGHIVGGENSQYWDQIKNDKWGGSVSNKFYNPIMQNDVHIKSLQEVLNYKYSLYSIVVFSEECILEDDIDLAGGNTRVVTISDLKETVETFYKYMNSDMSDSDIETAYNLLYPYTQVSDRVKNEHIRNIQDKYQSETKYIDYIYKQHFAKEREEL